MGDTISRKRIEDLELQVEHLSMQVRALQELCVRKKLFTREEFKTLVHEIDSVDGSMDGRTTRVGRPQKRGD